MAKMKKTLIASAALFVAAAVTVSGCGQSSSTSSPSTSAASNAAKAVTIDNCGVKTTFDMVPKRAVTLTSNATEVMLELGLEDKMVGTAYMRGREIAPKYKAAYEKIKVLSSEQPTMEQLLAVEPDFVYSGYPDGFSEKTGHTRKQLADANIKTHLNPEGCAKAPVKVEDIFTEITTIGSIFQAEDRAAKSVAELRARLDAVKAKLGKTEPVKVMLYASGDDKAATTGGNSMATALIEAAGGENVFKDVSQRWMSVSWEQVAERNPDVILVREEGTTPQYQSPSVAKKIETLKGVPAIANTTAMKNQRFATLTLSMLQPGPYSIDGVEHMAKQFHPDLFK